MRIAILLIAAVAAGCASAASSDPSPRQRIQNVGSDIELLNESTLRGDTIAASRDATLRALADTYEDLELPVTEVREAEGTLEALHVPTSQLVGERMSRFLDCGQGASGQRADSYAVRITLISSVLALDEERSTLWIDFDGLARPRSHAGSDVHCSSRGALEDRLFDEVRQRLGVGSG